jgi:DNA-binding NarL/FixJ family response regulator
MTAFNPVTTLLQQIEAVHRRNTLLRQLETVHRRNVERLDEERNLIVRVSAAGASDRQIVQALKRSRDTVEGRS